MEYVRVCGRFGVGYFYIPGTDICQNANAISQTQDAVAGVAATAYQGVAISSAIVPPFMPSTANFAVSAYWANFAGQDALGIAGLMRVSNSNLFLSGGIGASAGGGPVVSRAGVMFAW